MEENKQENQQESKQESIQESKTESRRAIKAAQRRKREEAIKKVPEYAKPKPAAEVEKKISFDQWWMLVNKRVSLPYWQKEVILADFKGRGLSKMETEESFDNALKMFGVKL